MELIDCGAVPGGAAFFCSRGLVTASEWPIWRSFFLLLM